MQSAVHIRAATEAAFCSAARGRATPPASWATSSGYRQQVAGSRRHLAPTGVLPDSLCRLPAAKLTQFNALLSCVVRNLKIHCATSHSTRLGYRNSIFRAHLGCRRLLHLVDPTRAHGKSDQNASVLRPSRRIRLRKIFVSFYVWKQDVSSESISDSMTMRCCQAPGRMSGKQDSGDFS